MGTFRKFTAFLATIAIVLSIVSVPASKAALNFKDANEIATYAKGAVEKLTEDSIAKGYADNTFRPNNNILRSEFLKLTIEAANKYAGKSYTVDLTNTKNDTGFVDLKDGDWSIPYFRVAKSAGIIQGYKDKNGNLTGYVGPNDKVNRAEAVKIIALTFGLSIEDADKLLSDDIFAKVFPDVKATDWFFSYVKVVWLYSVVNGYQDGTFGPANPITRQDTAAMLIGKSNDDGKLTTLAGAAKPATDDTSVKARVDQAKKIAEQSDKPTASNGTLTVSLNKNSPVAMSVPCQSNSIKMASFDFEATGDKITINGINLGRTGLGDRNDLSRIWAEHNGVRISGRQSVATDNSVSLTFFTPVVVNAGSIETIDIVANWNAVSNGACVSGRINALGIPKGGVDSNAKNVAGNFPIMGADMTSANYTVAHIYPSNAASGGSTYKVGDTQVELGSIQLTNASSNVDITLSQIALNNAGTADMTQNFENIGIMINGKIVTEVISTDTRNVVLKFKDGFTIEYGKTYTLSVKGDIKAVRNADGDDIDLQIRYAEDLKGVEKTTGYPIRFLQNNQTTSAEVSSVNLTGTWNGTSNKYKIKGGNITFSKATSTPPTQSVSPSNNGVTLLVADFDVKQQIRGDAFKVVLLATSLSATDLSTTFQNAKLYIDDKLVGTKLTSVSDFTVLGGCTDNTYSGYLLNFDTPQTINAKKQQIKVTIDVKSTAVQGTKIKAKIIGAVSGTNNGCNNATNVVSFFDNTAEYVSNGNKIKTDDVSGTVDSNVATVQQATLTVTSNHGISAGQNLVAGGNTMLGKWLFKASDTGTVRINKVTLQHTGDAKGGSVSITGIKLYQNGKQIGDQSKDISGSGNSVDFTVSFDVKANEQVTIEAKGVISSAYVPSGNTGSLQVNISTMDARDLNGNNITFNPSAFTDNAYKGPLYTILRSGQARFSYNSSTPASSVMTPGSTVQELGRISVSTRYDALRLTNMYLVNVANSGSWVGNTANSQYDPRVGSIKLYKNSISDANFLTNGAIQNGVVSFSIPTDGSGSLLLPSDTSDFPIVIGVSYNSIDNINQTNAMFRLVFGTGTNSITHFSNVKQSGTTDYGARIISDSTGEELRTVDVSITSALAGVTLNGAPVVGTNLMNVTKSKPTVTMSTNRSITSNTFVGSNVDLYAFNISAEGGPLAWRTIAFDITTSMSNGATINLSNLKLYKYENGTETERSITSSLTTNQFSGGYVTNGTAIVQLSDPEVVSAGTTSTYVLKGALDGAIVASSTRTFAIKLKSDESVTTPHQFRVGAYATFIPSLNANDLGSGSFIWTDMSDGDSSLSTPDWYNGYKIPNLSSAPTKTYSQP